MNNKIEVGSFDVCLLLQFVGSSIHGKPVKTVQVSNGWEFDVFNYVEMNTSDGLEIIRAISQLPYGEQMRCHNPSFGIELLNNGEQVFLCSICWGCNNIFVLNNGMQDGITFDSTSEEAKHLFDKFKLAFNAIIDLEDA